MSTISRRLALLPITASLALSLGVAPLAPSPVAATGGESFVSTINGYRHNAGLGPVFLHSVVDQVAQERSNEVAAARQLGHDFPALINRLAQVGVCWERLGEIVLYNSRLDYNIFAQQWYNSPTHQAIMLGAEFTHAGGSWTQGSDGRYYAVMVFVKLCGHSPAPPTQTYAGFTDIYHSPFRDDIAWLVQAGITNGCGGGRFCPTAPVTRDQMASFLRRARNLPAATRDWFWDDAGSLHEDDINRVADAGITQGCGPGRYCPGTTVAREQMASFLVRALNLPPTGHDYFWDDNGSLHEADINRLAAAGITTGCGAGQYCPGGTVTREQMAAFLHRAFD